MPFLVQALSLAQPLVLALLAAAVVYLVPLVRRRTKSKLVGDALAALTTLAATTVANAFQTTVAALKDPARPGQWDTSAAIEVKARVLTDLRMLAHGTLRDLAATGMEPEALDALLSQTVERAVVDLKARAPAAPPSKPASSDKLAIVLDVDTTEAQANVAALQKQLDLAAAAAQHLAASDQWSAASEAAKLAPPPLPGSSR